MVGAVWTSFCEQPVFDYKLQRKVLNIQEEINLKGLFIEKKGYTSMIIKTLIVIC